LSKGEWTEVIKADHKWSKLGLKETFRYTDLILLFVRRDIISQYKQTILGPLWIVLQPLITAIVFTFVFGNVAGIPVGDIPYILFYMSGLVCWKYFDECMKKTSNVFIQNSGIFGKVYFPRLTVPLSITITGLVVFFIQLTMFAVFFTVFCFNGETGFESSNAIKLLAIPLIVINIAAIGLGLGLIISSLTTRYRDLRFLVDFGIQLLMYLSPVIMPVTKWKESESVLKYIAIYNPLSPIIEFFRSIFFDVQVDYGYLMYSAIFGLIVLLIGVIIFNKVERNFMDTI
jgi:lipopolysaccharide transport system permease protein